jgi:signal transduction histidine kinase
LTEKQREYLHTAIESSGRMVDIIDDMLDLAKLESGKANLHFEKRDVMEPIREAYSLLAPFASINGIEISIDPVPAGILAYFDGDNIRGVLTNIIDNAIKFTPSGGRIGISVVHDGDFVLVSVSDTGCGIPENQISSIFDEFAQLRSHAGSKRGSGLGLAICKRIVDAHKGRIWAASTPRQGSRFTFSLPLTHTSDS